jgi:hypothetical protein
MFCLKEMAYYRLVQLTGTSTAHSPATCTSLSIHHPLIPPLRVPPLPFSPPLPFHFLNPSGDAAYKTINPAKTAANKPPPSTANPAAAPLDSLGWNPAEEVVVEAPAVSVVLVADIVVVTAVADAVEELTLAYAFAALQ